jgi:hypothetical protein
VKVRLTKGFTGAFHLMLLQRALVERLPTLIGHLLLEMVVLC